MPTTKKAGKIPSKSKKVSKSRSASKKSGNKQAGNKTANAIVQHSIKRYGWIPDIPDHRDKMFAAPMAVVGALPASVDMRANCPPICDQGQLGSCTGNAIAGALEFDQMKQALANIFAPSRLFIYYNERVMERTVNEDAGAMIRDGIKSVGKVGAPPETDWPYDISKFTQKPPKKAYTHAAKHKAVLYQKVSQDATQMKACLAGGDPIIIGFSVYQSFEGQKVAKTGHAPMPNPSSERLLGGHCVMVVGYDDGNQWFICRNSWGTKWGMAGYFTMPYPYLLDPNLSDDFWTIKIVN